MHLKQSQLFMMKHVASCPQQGMWKKPKGFVVSVGQHVLLKQAEDQDFSILSDLLESQAVPGKATCTFQSMEALGSTCQRFFQPALTHKPREYFTIAVSLGFPPVSRMCHAL